MPIRVFDEEEKQNIKAKMIEAGLPLIKKYGLTHTSVVKITQSAGIGKSTFYNFFPSKEVFVIELIQYERAKLMNYFDQLLNGREKMTKQEAKTFLKKIIFHQDSIYQYLTEEDMETLYPAMQEQGMIEEDLNSDMPEFLFSHFEEINPDADNKIFVNFLRIMALAVSQKEALHEDVLDETLEMIYERMFQYIFVS
ncbi:MAG: TetR/AcrR family transcriptional regulator [Hespellia sp.]|nr:TetR/AcrR family transcriptional regulator [Hespellia sp.]MDD3416561.1 TetR/AcrR family transcriptional regulator [Lachnospiraceae bacterium]